MDLSDLAGLKAVHPLFSIARYLYSTSLPANLMQNAVSTRWILFITMRSSFTAPEDETNRMEALYLTYFII